MIEDVPLDQVPICEIVRVWVSLPILKDKAIVTLIKCQKKELAVEDCTIVQEHVRDTSEGSE